MVKLTGAELKVKDLVTDAVTLISSTGLEFTNNIKIHATIGITCDDQPPLLVGIDKIIKKGTENENSLLLPSTSTSTPSSLSLATPMMSDLSKLGASMSSFQPPPIYPGSIYGSPITPNVSVTMPITMREREQFTAANSSKGQKRPHSPSRDIPKSLTTPSANSNHQERVPPTTYQQHKQSKVTPISVVPESMDDDDDQPQNLVIKEEAMSDTENHEQSAPLNMSVSQEQSKNQSTPLREPKVPALPPPVNSPFPEQSEESPAPPAPASVEQDQWPTASCSLLKNALNTPQQARKTPSPPNKSPVEKNVDGKDGDLGYVLMPSTQSAAYQLEKKYVCDQAGCSYMSTRKYNLTRHARTHYEDQRIPCPECSGTFVDKYILKEHMASTHPKFTVPINGTNMIGVGIGSTTKVQSEPLVGPLLPNQERPTIPPAFFQQPPNKRKKTAPNRSTLRRNTPSPKNRSGTSSPNSRRSSKSSPGRPGSSWHIPHQLPTANLMAAGNGPTTSSAVDASNAGAPSVEEMIKMMGSNNSASIKDSIPSTFQSVFPGMLEMNNNEPKTDDDDERTSASSPASSGANLPVFPGMMGSMNGESSGTAQLSTTSQ